MSHGFARTKTLKGLAAVDSSTGYIEAALIAPVAPSGGSATTIEVELGSAASFAGKFTITDAGITASKKVMCWQAPGPYTGKGTRSDEAEMQPVQVISVTPAEGSAVVSWQTPPMLTMQAVLDDGRRNVAGAAYSSLVAQVVPFDYVPTRLGRIRGNVKFSYMVLT